MSNGRKNKWMIFGISALTIIILITVIFIVVSTVQKSQEKSRELTEKYEVLLDDYEQLLEEREQLQQSLENIDDERENETEQLEKSLKDLEEEIESKQQIIDDLKDEIEKLEEEVEQLTKELEAKKERESEIANQHINNNGTQKKNGSTKKVFLTFDDGPSSNTLKILDILAKENVPASFFVIGKAMENNPSIVQRAYNEGHMILPHSYSHDYAIYTSFDTFYDDLEKIEKVYEEVLNVKPPTIFRFPGGSSNHTSFKYGGKQFMPMLTVDVKERNYTYVDWNVSSGDTGSNRHNPKKMLEDIKKQSQGKDFIVLLFHDTEPNKGTVEALPDIIKYYRENGYTFRSFRDITSEELKQMENLKIANKPIVRK